MAVRTTGAFVVGVGVGWTLRATLGSTRELLVRALVATHKLRDGARVFIAEYAEWAEDMFAEGRARYEAMRDETTLDDDAPPQVFTADSPAASAGSARRGRAA